MSSDETGCSSHDLTDSLLTQPRQESHPSPTGTDDAPSLPPQAMTQPTTTTTTTTTTTNHPRHHHLATNADDATNPTTTTTNEGVADEATRNPSHTTLPLPQPPSPPSSPSPTMGFLTPVALGSSNGCGSHAVTNGSALPPLQEAESNGVPRDPRPHTSRATQNTGYAVPPANMARVQRGRETISSLSQRLVKGKPVKRKLWEVDHVQMAAELDQELARVTEEEERRFHRRWKLLPPEQAPHAPSFYYSQFVGPAGKGAVPSSPTSTSTTPPHTSAPRDVRLDHTAAKRRRVDPSSSSAAASVRSELPQVFSNTGQKGRSPAAAAPKMTTSTPEDTIPTADASQSLKNGGVQASNSNTDVVLTNTNDTAFSKSAGVAFTNTHTTTSNNSRNVSSSTNVSTTVSDCSISSSISNTTTTSNNSCSIASSSVNTSTTSNDSCIEELNSSTPTPIKSGTTPAGLTSESEATSPRSPSSGVTPTLNVSGSSKSSSGVSSADSTPSEDVLTPPRQTTPTQEGATPRRAIRKERVRRFR
ncbi:LOW QUALITY PROTEIN: uncharacterized protein [Panulirus ornatus]|uniref:LOW QUALITY PROTEIN: uncharacterized protein n=1 Tax=Panulirus ornatus TaxID=150431 RepID=UPI003A8855A2